MTSGATGRSAPLLPASRPAVMYHVLNGRGIAAGAPATGSRRLRPFFLRARMGDGVSFKAGEEEAVSVRCKALCNPVDGSELSNAAVGIAVALYGPFNAKPILLHFKAAKGAEEKGSVGWALSARSIGTTSRALRLFAVACAIAFAPTTALSQSAKDLHERASSSTPNARSYAAQSRTRLITLGTAGGPLPRADRAQSSNALIVNGTPYLIDAGDGVTRRLVQAGIDFRKIDHIFITHNHNDHMAGLATLLDSEWQYSHRAPIHVYGPPGTEAVVKGAIQYFSSDAEIRSIEGKNSAPLSEVFVGHDLEPGPIYQDANIKVIAVENTHYHFPPNSLPYGKHRSYSYRFETPDRVFVFSGDTGASQALADLSNAGIPPACD